MPDFLRPFADPGDWGPARHRIPQGSAADADRDADRERPEDN